MNEIQNKLLQYEVQPPARAWDSIAAVLDHGSDAVGEKLYQFEQAPPLGSWKKINELLGQQASQQLPFFQRYRRPLKYSTAIAAMVVLSILVSLLISKKSVSEGVPSLTGKVIPKETKKDAANVTASVDAPKQLSIAHINPNKPVKHLNLASIKTSFWLGPELAVNTSAIAEKLVPEYAERRTVIDYPSSADKYMVYSDGEGAPLRLPKKLYDAFACATDKISCKQKLKKLQEQVAASAVKADFTGILDMLSKLEENQ